MLIIICYHYFGFDRSIDECKRIVKWLYCVLVEDMVLVYSKQNQI